MLEDSDIIELYLKRDERAIDETATKYGPYCEKIALNILNNQFDAEECVNDTYLRTWNSIPPTLPRIFSAFLAKITRNVAIDKYKSRNAEKRIANPISLDELSECVGDGTISDQLEISAIGSAISKFLHGESEINRRIFVRRYFFEDSVRDIAKFYRISESKVKTSLHRTRERLKRFLEKEGIYI